MKDPKLNMIRWPAVQPLLWVASLLFRWIVWIRNLAFESGLLRVARFPSLTIVSIGNLSVGGTGKSPMVEFLARQLMDQFRVGLVSRGYGRKTKGSLAVDDDLHDPASLFGDEPVMLYRKLKIPVQVSERRVQGVRDLLAREPKLDLVIADDAFQHRWLGRDFDLVLIDGTESAESRRWLPLGLRRESDRSLRRASAVILTKCEQLSADQLLELRSRWAGHDKPVACFGQGLSFSEPLETSFVVVSGLASNEAFSNLLNKCTLTNQLNRTFEFPDHHVYTQSDVALIIDYLKANSIRQIVTTEKDAPKLLPVLHAYMSKQPDRWEFDFALVLAKLTLAPLSDEDQAKVSQLLSQISSRVESVRRKETL